MTAVPIDEAILTTALDNWERDPASYTATPFYAFSLAYPTEASYLWQLLRGTQPPRHFVDEALRHLVDWALVDPSTATLTPLGRRLLESRQGGTRPRGVETSAQRVVSSPSASPSPSASAPAPSRRGRAMSVEAARLSDRELHLLGEIGAGRNRIFVMDERPPGWTTLERLGLATRAPGDRAHLTPDGKELLEGVEAGRGEVREDGWSREAGERYLAEVGPPNSVFDAGHQAGIRSALGLNATSKRSGGAGEARTSARERAPARAPSPATASSGQRRVTPLTPAKVLADLRKATGLAAAVRTKRVKRSGIAVRKHSPAVVFVTYYDHEDRGDQPTVWPTLLEALERAGYTLGMADGSTGAAAKSKSLRTGAVLVARSRAGASGSGSASAERSPTPTPASAAATSSASRKAPTGSWAWTQDAQVFIPDERVSPLPTDELLPLRGYGYIEAVRRDGKIIGWAERP